MFLPIPWVKLEKRRRSRRSLGYYLHLPTSSTPCHCYTLQGSLSIVSVGSGFALIDSSSSQRAPSSITPLGRKKRGHLCIPCPCFVCVCVKRERQRDEYKHIYIQILKNNEKCWFICYGEVKQGHDRSRCELILL